MKTLPRFPPTQGFTLVEIMVVSLLASFFVIFLFGVMRNFSNGVVNVQRNVPLQRDLQLAKSIIEKDLLSAPRSSIGNVVPDPGFESRPTKLSDSLPTRPGFWACEPTRFKMDGGLKYATGFVTSHPNYIHTGNAALTIDTRGTVGAYTAHSSTFSLIGGRQYLFGAWVLTTDTNGIQGSIALIRDPAADAPPPTGVTGWPETDFFFLYRYNTHWSDVLNLDLGRWFFICRPFTATDNTHYRIRAGNASSNNTRLVCTVDDFVVIPTTWTMNNVRNEMLEFDNVVVDGPLAGQKVRLRYRWAPKGASGQIIRERIDSMTGAVLQTLDPLNNIRYMNVAWDFGQPIPGDLPTPLLVGAIPPPSGSETAQPAWDNFFQNGLNFPLVITLEVGNIGADAPNFLSLSFSVFPEMP
jgi:hypothetical protein